MAVIKTNAMRILDKNKIQYDILTYDNNDGKIDGVSVANKISVKETKVFKTIVTISTNKNIYVFLIPVNEELDFKKAAKIAGEKSIEMIDVKDLLKYTGYIRGGCSPIGMKKIYKTYIHKSAEELDFMVFSGGKIGIQIKANPLELLNILNAEFVDLTK